MTSFRLLRRVALVAAAAMATLLGSCTFHSTAVHWNGLRDADGHPVFIKSSTNIGMHLCIVLPVIGNTTLDAMIRESTRSIAAKGGSRVRVIQAGSESYWYGWPPFTWFVTPVVTDIVLEYEPSAEEHLLMTGVPVPVFDDDQSR
ncbi:MAG: hypothetical protein AB8H80_07525 [Planctomycetota bacterium]